MKIYYRDRKEILKDFRDFSQLKSAVSVGEDIELVCSRYEYFVLPLWLVGNAQEEMVSVSVTSEDTKVTCFNTQGVDKYGKSFGRSLVISKDEISPVYFGFDCTVCQGSKITAEITLYAQNIRCISVVLNLTDEKVEYSGFNDLWRLSRLKWLNSSEGLDKKAVMNYQPVQYRNNAASITGRRLRFGAGCMLEQAESFFDESVELTDQVQCLLFSRPLTFEIEGEKLTFGENIYCQDGDKGILTARCEQGNIHADVQCRIGYEGCLDYEITVCAQNDCVVQDLRLTAFYTKQASVYNNGLGKWGGYYKNIDFRWNDENQDCLWTGGINCGARFKWMAENYQHPLVNIYYHSQPLIKPETTWDNHGSGSITAKRLPNETQVCASTGAFRLKKDEPRKFRFQIHITPFSAVDYKANFRTRYYHTQDMNRPADEIVSDAKRNGMNYIIVHHGNIYHPYINYPFIAVDAMRELVNKAHAAGIGVKYYYTIREHGNHMAEVFVYKSFGDEIIYRKKREGFSWQDGKAEWLSTYFGDEIIPAWRVLYEDGPYRGDHDISFLVHPDSRLENYYIEGLKWLVEEIGIDGIYIDDTAIDRITLERARKVLNTERAKSSLPKLIDMHMWNAEQDCAGNASAINLYTEILPFLDSLWIGEEFPCSTMTVDAILTEVSGLPYGKWSQMLQDGGNPFVGMLYMMNNRYGWTHRNATAIYSLWDDFEIADSHIRGYWDSRVPIKTDHADVLVTCYVKKNRTLAVICNMGRDTVDFKMLVDEEKLGFTPDFQTARLPEVTDIQKSGKFDFSEMHTLKPRCGYFVYLEQIL